MILGELNRILKTIIMSMISFQNNYKVEIIVILQMRKLKYS